MEHQEAQNERRSSSGTALRRLGAGVGVIALCLVGLVAEAAEVDAATLYEISTEGSSKQVKSGEKGKVVIEIRAAKEAHVSTEAPLRIELVGKGAKPEKEKLTLADSVGQKQPGQDYANPRFEVPFSVTEPGAKSIEAKMVFFICTDTLCARQQRNVSVAFEAK